LFLQTFDSTKRASNCVCQFLWIGGACRERDVVAAAHCSLWLGFSRCRDGDDPVRANGTYRNHHNDADGVSFNGNLGHGRNTVSRSYERELERCAHDRPGDVLQ
jgi:hypothetical protein